MRVWKPFWVLSLLLATASSVAADQDFVRGRLFPPDVITQHRQALKLTDRQSEAIRDVIRGSQSEVMGLRWDMMSTMDAVTALLDEATVDEDGVAAQVEALLKLENAVKLEQIRMLIRIRNVLTPEQVSYLRSATGANDG